jgi:hypothetical protein
MLCAKKVATGAARYGSDLFQQQLHGSCFDAPRQNGGGTP